MPAPCDTSFVFSLIDRVDPQHARCRVLYLTLPDLLLPAPALTELSYLFYRTGGNNAVSGALRTVREGHIDIVDLIGEDYDRAKILNHLDGTGDQHSPSLREAITHLENAPCVKP
jgi:hypothetical protein